MRAAYLLIGLLFVAAIVPVNTFLDFSPVQIWNAQNPYQLDRYRTQEVYTWDFAYTTVQVEYLPNSTAIIRTIPMADSVSVSIDDYRDCRTRNNRNTCIQWLVKSPDPVQELVGGSARTYYSASYRARQILINNVRYVMDEQDRVAAWIAEDNPLESLDFGGLP